MAFSAHFTVSQSIDGSVLTLADDTNYGDGGSFHKVDMSTRVLYITRADTMVEQAVPFPYTNTDDSIVDQYEFEQDQDYTYSIRMVITSNLSIEYTFTTTVITTEFHNQQLREILGDVDSCGCSGDCRLAQKIQCAIDAATARACAADIAGSQRLLEYATELFDNHNC